MWNPVVILVLCLWSFTHAVPLGLKKNMAIMQEEEEPMLMLAGDEETRPEMMISRLNLPSNATSIRADITDGFSCDNKTYGYYADVENECQIFHVCLPVTYADGKENTFRWSFICPEETVFSQDSFTCMRPEDMSIDCEESFKYYELNRNFGMIESEDTQMSAEDEMNMEEMSRQPSSQELSEDKQMFMPAPPAKKQTNKVQTMNRRKTQSNRINSEAQRKKVQPLRKIPQPVALPTTTKTVEEEAPVPEQEAERTTVKYQRFNKRPVTATKEQLKPEPAKPEQQIVRQELFTQKRKRPQTYSGTRFDALEESQKPESVLPVQPEPVQPAQAEAQASEIAEVSIKPQTEKIAEPKPVEVEKPESLAAKEKEPVADLKSEITPIAENFPIRVEVVEVPIQKTDAPVINEAPAVFTPIAEEPKPMAEIMEEKLPSEEIMPVELPKAAEADEEPEAAKTAVEIPAESKEQMEAEKVLLEPLAEPGQLVDGSETENLMETVKAAEPETLMPEPAKTEMAAEPEAEMPVAEPETGMKTEYSAAELEPEKPSEDEMPMKVEVPTELDADEKPAEPEMLLKVESPIVEPEMAPQLVEAPMQAELPEKPAAEPAPEAQKPLETEETPLDMEMTKVASPVEEIPMEAEMDVAEKPAEVMVVPQPEMTLESEKPKTQFEKSNEMQEEAMQTSDQVPAQPKPTSEDVSLPSPSEGQDAQSLILDFISSLVNSESSNMEEQAENVEEMPAESIPEPAISELKLTEDKPAESEPAPEEPKPMYMPLMPNTDQMYHIPVQVIETPEPEMPIQTAEPKLPLSIDDVVELVKESLDSPAEKENLVQEMPAAQPEGQSNSDEVKPIYHRYFDIGSNLLKSEALTASDEEEPKIISNDKLVEDEQPLPANTMDASPMGELPSSSDPQPEPEKLASEPEPVLNSLQAATKAEVVPSEPASADRLPMSRSMNRFKMDPRKRRFLFRSDAS